MPAQSLLFPPGTALVDRRGLFCCFRPTARACVLLEGETGRSRKPSCMHQIVCFTCQRAPLLVKSNVKTESHASEICLDHSKTVCAHRKPERKGLCSPCEIGNSVSAAVVSWKKGICFAVGAAKLCHREPIRIRMWMRTEDAEDGSRIPGIARNAVKHSMTRTINSADIAGASARVRPADFLCAIRTISNPCTGQCLCRRLIDARHAASNGSRRTGIGSFSARSAEEIPFGQKSMMRSRLLADVNSGIMKMTTACFSLGKISKRCLPAQDRHKGKE